MSDVPWQPEKQLVIVEDKPQELLALQRVEEQARIVVKKIEDIYGKDHHYTKELFVALTQLDRVRAT